MSNSETTIYHNPKCSKSRATLQLLEEHGIEPKIIKYLDTPPSREELQHILEISELTARDLLRSTEQVFKDAGMDEEGLSDSEIIDAVAECPTLLQRPIVVTNGKAAMGRPPENILKILK